MFFVRGLSGSLQSLEIMSFRWQRMLVAANLRSDPCTVRVLCSVVDGSPNCR
jgi:hypothetical protein